jgi:adenylate cyclase class 2
MKETEIEIQTKIENSKPLLDFLEKEAVFESENHQIDEYFTPDHRDFTSLRPIEEWFRLRDSNGKFSVNYKKWHFDSEGRGLYADEYETKIDNPEMMKKIINSLDLKSLMIVDKKRKIWKYKDYEISMDSVKGLGDFVEIEYYGERHHDDHKKITEEMIKFLKEDLGCGKLEINHSGYPALLLGRGERVDIF